MQTVNKPNVYGGSAAVGQTGRAGLQVPIAICGIAIRLPGGIKSPRALWEFLIVGGDARGRVPPSRFDHHRPNSPEGHARIMSEHGYFLDDDLRCLDVSFFNMPPAEVERMDPQQRLLLEVVRECLEDAGETRWRGEDIGCYVGKLGDQYPKSGQGGSALSARISDEFNLKGPSATAETGCSASLVALHNACIAISHNECNSAVIGGTNLIMESEASLDGTTQHMLSKDGSSKTFSADADGCARGEAIAAVYVKKLESALADGNPIRAVIRGTSIIDNENTSGIELPSGAAQESLIRRAYSVAGIAELDIAQTAFVECHGNGGPTGDSIEANAIGRVFQGRGTYIGSISPNLGHSQGASGIVSLIKAVLALENSTIPPNIKSEPLSPAIQFQEARLIVPTQPTRWPQDRLKRVGVNSFGVHGTSAHAIFDAVEGEIGYRPSPPLQEANEPQLLLFSANSPVALSRIVENYHNHLAKKPSVVQDVAFTLANHREQLRYRCFTIAHQSSISVPSTPVSPVAQPSLIMVFSGSGAQWPQMGRNLMQSNLHFAQSIRMLDHLFQWKLASDWSIEDEIKRPANESRLHLTRFAEPACTAIQIALVDTFEAIGVHPDAVIGHSSGEIAAAYAANILTAEQAITIAFHRGVVADHAERSGGMMGLEEEYPDVLKDIVNIAPRVPFFSSVTGGLRRTSFDPGYWQQNVEAPVKFQEAVSSIFQHPIGNNPVFLEIGPDATLADSVRQQSQSPYVSALIRNKNGMESWLSAVGTLHVHGKSIDLRAAIPNGSCLADLPRYPWDHDHS